MPRSFPCPRCGEASTWEGNEFRPFCSERCKLIDLGAWASEEYKLPTQDAPQAGLQRHEDDYED
ncbi:DNA gyrase inhibitor YacG [Acinetobacter venetianus]|uniref:DNA gyrase inhibitor YacG n=1 Tax=Acinetobacter venetianus TaxID=52133 RepID=UPI00036FA94F|nr:DNA gyrase inhibitor YacG [Acinetobacter venetianus]MCR4531838.1 DNA gyrase inhibitor YacG [Acinetobacter venetianus]MDA0695634.1 DNA gyrase inhibitor YacG [Pseudomonadota bacterium]MDA1253023.1 DNA gyrase inhibitor YacG [Pseudomonadota bacterium]